METTTQVTVTMKGVAHPKEIAQQLRFQAGIFEGMDGKAAASNENTGANSAPLANGHDKTEKVNPAKTAKKASAVKKVEQQEEFNLEADSAEMIEDADPLGIDESEEQTEEPQVTKEDVIKALQAYVKKNDRDKAIKIVQKFAKSGAVKDLTPEQYPKVMKALGA